MLSLDIGMMSAMLAMVMRGDSSTEPRNGRKRSMPGPSPPGALPSRPACMHAVQVPVIDQSFACMHAIRASMHAFSMAHSRKYVPCMQGR